jgi:hypothetical protein
VVAPMHGWVSIAPIYGDTAVIWAVVLAVMVALAIAVMGATAIAVMGATVIAVVRASLLAVMPTASVARSVLGHCRTGAHGQDCYNCQGDC